MQIIIRTILFLFAGALVTHADQKHLNYGTVPNDGIGDSLRVTQSKAEHNFNHLFGDLDNLSTNTVPGAVRAFPLISDMIAADPTSGTNAIVFSGYSVGDNLGGAFQWDSSSTLSPDTNSVFASTFSPGDGRWLRRSFNTISTGTTTIITNKAVLTVDSVAVLKSLSVSNDIGWVILKGYFNPGDGWGGPVYYDPASGETPEGGMIFDPNNGSGRWKRPPPLLSEWNVGNWGGITNATFDLAQQWATDHGGGTLLFGPGGTNAQYTISAPLDVKDNTVIQMAPGAVITSDGTISNLFQVIARTNVAFVDSAILGATNGIYIYASTNVKVVRTTIADCETGVLRVGNTTVRMEDNSYSNCTTNIHRASEVGGLEFDDHLLLPEIATPGTVSGSGSFYAKSSDNKPHFKASTGTDYDLTGASPGGSTTQFQYNNAGAFGGTATATWDNAAGQATFRKDGTTSFTPPIFLANLDTAAGSAGSALEFDVADTSANRLPAVKLFGGKNSTWTSTASTRDGDFQVWTKVDDVFVEHLQLAQNTVAVPSGIWLSAAGGILFPSITTAKTSAYVATTSDFEVPCDTSSGGFVVSLPAAPLNGELLAIKKVSNDSNTITVSGNGHNIDDSASFFLAGSAFPVLVIQYDATRGVWAMLSYYPQALTTGSVPTFAGITLNGTASINTGTLTLDGAGLNVVSRWNNGATVFTGVSKISLTDSAHAGGSQLVNWQVNSAPVYTMNSLGSSFQLSDIYDFGTIHLTNGTAALQWDIAGGNATAIQGTGTFLSFLVNSSANYMLLTTAELRPEGTLNLGNSAHPWEKMFLSKTMTAGGTVGAQTINKSSGRVNFAASASSLVVTDSYVTTNSIVMVQVCGTDATATSARVTKAAGSFTITLNAAATAETEVDFLIAQ